MQHVEVEPIMKPEDFIVTNPCSFMERYLSFGANLADVSFAFLYNRLEAVPGMPVIWQRNGWAKE
jgi:hypothetical protein